MVAHNSQGAPVGSSGTAANAPNAQLGKQKYSFDPPARRPLNFAEARAHFRHAFKSFLQLAGHALSAFQSAPVSSKPLTLTEPAGQISADMLEVCKHLYDESEARLSKLETKSTALLSLLVVVIPLAISAAVFLRQHPLPPVAATAALWLNIVALAFFVLGLLGTLRAMAVRPAQTLFLEAVIGPATDSIRKYSPDFFGRGLLLGAAHRHAVCDHIADFVRGAQLFLVLGVALAAGAAAGILRYVQEDSQKIEGTVGLDADTLYAFKTVVAVSRTYEARLNKIDTELAAVKQLQPDRQAVARLDALSEEVRLLRVQMDAQAAARDDSKSTTKASP